MTAARVIFLMGATATGKTELALEIAKNFDVEIISVDSALVYRHMDIGTAKPTASVRRQVPHHLIDILDPAAAYSAWDFVQQSRSLAAEISARGRIPLLTGGSMLYFQAFERGLNRLPAADAALRLRLDREARRLGWPQMHRKLAAIDAESARRIEPTDAQRIQRALEVFEISGEPLSRLQQQAATGYGGGIEKIILAVNDRAALHRRIEERFLQMMEQGLVDEVARLKQRGDLNLSMPSMRCVGYRQVWQHLAGELSQRHMVAKAIAATRQLAKRQITWLRKQPQKGSFDCLNYRKDAIFQEIETALTRALPERF